jgi:hypothetical protein
MSLSISLSAIIAMPNLSKEITGKSNTKSIDITSYFFVGGGKGRMSLPHGCRNAFARFHASQDSI